jgi:hypothetical protein
MSCLVAAYLLGELLSLGLDVLNRSGLFNTSENTTSNLSMRAYHVECRLRQVIVCTRKNLPERADGVLQGYELAFVTREDLCDLEGLRHETLNLTSTLDLVSVSNQYYFRLCIHSPSTCPLLTIHPYLEWQ